MPENKKSIAIYSRKSRFTGKGESIGNQEELCREYIRAHYGAEAAEEAVIYEDEGFSGGNLERPGFRKMMAAAKEKRLRAIIVYRLDRISRNISDFSGLIEELARLDIAFISMKEQFDTGTPMGRAMMYIASVFSQLERETIAERIRDNMHELAKTGRWLGGTTPLGYASESVKSVTVDGKTRKACRLKVLPEEAEVVKTIYGLFLENGSLTLTEAELMRRRQRTRNGNYFSRFSIKAILQNPVYVTADREAYDFFEGKGAQLFADRASFDATFGVLAYHRTDQEKGRAAVLLPVCEWIISVGRHPGLISGKVWVEVQEMLERNKSGSYRSPRKNEALLTGLLYCGCGSRMYPKLSRSRTEEGEQVFTYVCRLKERSQRSLCMGKNADGNGLDRAVLSQVKALEEDHCFFVQSLERAGKLLTEGDTGCEAELFRLRRENAETDRKMTALVDSLAGLEESRTRAHVAERMKQLEQEQEAILLRIRGLEQELCREQLDAEKFSSLCSLLAGFETAVEKMTVEQKRSALRSLVQRIVWDGENAHVFLYGAGGALKDALG